MYVIRVFAQKVLLRSCSAAFMYLQCDICRARTQTLRFIIAAHILQSDHFYICEQKNKVRRFFVAIARLS